MQRMFSDAESCASCRLAIHCLSRAPLDVLSVPTHDSSGARITAAAPPPRQHDWPLRLGGGSRTAGIRG